MGELAGAGLAAWGVAECLGFCVTRAVQPIDAHAMRPARDTVRVDGGTQGAGGERYRLPPPGDDEPPGLGDLAAQVAFWCPAEAKPLASVLAEVGHQRLHRCFDLPDDTVLGFHGSGPSTE